MKNEKRTPVFALAVMLIASASSFPSSADAAGIAIPVNVTGDVVYTVTYAGKPSFVKFLFGREFLAGLAALLLAAICAAIVLLRKNTKIYTPEPDGAAYELLGKCRLNARNPHIDLCGLRRYPRGEAIVEVDAKTARRMFGRLVRISLREGTRTHLIERTGNENYWFTVSTETERESEVSE